MVLLGGVLHPLRLHRAIGIRLFGDVYYEKKGEVKSFGIANRVVAGLVGAYYVARLAEGLSGG